MNDDALEVRREDVLKQHAIPATMIRDLLAVANLDDESVENLVRALSQLQGVEGKDRLENRLAECVRGSMADEPSAVQSIVRVLINLEPEGLPRLVQMLDRWRQSATERHLILDDPTFERLDRNLKRLVADMPTVQLIRKANALLRVVGNEFQSVDFFCDLRPVFDNDRKSVEGFINLANMRLMYVTQSGDQQCCEIALTEDELEEFIRNGEQALSKLAVLKSMRWTTAPDQADMG